ncbi:uncharacterized protein LOC134779739 [Penaeus indicus]|uniref:uncharacterized protein LOC134779739 n=1 Tax=Penaeus indicus TaxID=29960 RepID=UPI00300D05F1
MRFHTVWSLITPALFASRCSAIPAEWWYSVKIANSTLSTGRLVELVKLSKESCVALATLSTWCDLFCYQDGRCLISEVKVAGSQDDSSLGPTFPCWTKHACLFHGVGYEEDDTFVDRCLPFKCQSHNVIVQLPAVSSSCNESFTVVPGVGCVYLHPHKMTWCDPRAVCRDYGGQFVPPEDFHAFSQRLAHDDVAWIGVRGRQWTDCDVADESREDEYDFWYEQAPDSSLDGPFELICEI